MVAAADLHILIPCKPLNEGKSRLAAVLDPAARRRLCRQLLTDTLRKALTICAPCRVHVVSADPEVAAIARENGATRLPDPGFGLNAALEAARDELTAAAPISLLVLPIDLPYVLAGEIAALLPPGEDVLVASDRAGSGTNLLCLGPAAAPRFAFRFGLDSFAAHTSEARRLGLSFRRLSSAAIGFDIDEPEDFLAWTSGLAPAAALLDKVAL